jgi:hypothetical protein
MQEVAAAVPMLVGDAAVRAYAALAQRRGAKAHDCAPLRAEWAALMSPVTTALRGVS